MGSDYTQKVFDAVERARRQVRSAESHFQSEKSRVEIEARYTTININNMSKAMEILADVKRTTDDLYTSYETIIRTLDEECRPYLDFGVSGTAIKEVADLMAEINEESSSLSSNATGSFNGMSMGDLRTEHYFASLEARTIEKFWATKYSMSPECEAERKRQEAALAERRKRQAEQAKIAAERRKKEEEEKKRKAALKEEEEKRVAKINAEAKQYMDKCDRDCNKKLSDYEVELECYIKNQKRKYQAEINNKVAEIKKSIEELKNTEAQLSVFKFLEKKSIKEEIQKLEARITKYENPAIIDEEINAMQTIATEAVEKYKNELESYMSKRFSDYKTSTKKKSKTTLLYVEDAEMAKKPFPSGIKAEEVFK